MLCVFYLNKNKNKTVAFSGAGPVLHLDLRGGYEGVYAHVKTHQALASVAQLVGAMSCKLEGGEFKSQLGHIPSLQVRSPVGVHARGKNRCFCLTSMFLFLLSPLSKIDKHVLW